MLIIVKLTSGQWPGLGRGATLGPFSGRYTMSTRSLCATRSPHVQLYPGVAVDELWPSVAAHGMPRILVAKQRCTPWHRSARRPPLPCALRARHDLILCTANFRRCASFAHRQSGLRRIREPAAWPPCAGPTPRAFSGLRRTCPRTPAHTRGPVPVVRRPPALARLAGAKLA